MAIQVTQLFAPTLLTGSAATIYTVPSSPSTTVLKGGRVRLTNVDTAARAVTMYAIQSAGSASDTNTTLKAETIGPNTHLDVDVPMLAASGFIQAFCDSANKVSIQCVDGVLFS